MIVYHNDGKGWSFYNPGSKGLLKSVITVFPYKDKFTKHVEEPEMTAKTSESLNKLMNPLQHKGYISFIVDALKLGSFEGKETVSAEDACVQTIANTLDVTAPHILPRTYQEAMEN